MASNQDFHATGLARHQALRALVVATWAARVHGLHSQFRPDYQIPTADRLNEVFRIGGTISWAALASGSSTTPTPLLLDYHSASGSATEVLSLPTPGMLNTVNSSTAGAETRRKSTSDANFPPCPSPKCQRHGQSRVGGVASLGYSDRRPAPLASAAPGLLHSAIRCGPTPTLPVGPLLRGTDRGGALGGGGEGPDLAAEAPAEAALEATTPKAETTAEATTRRAEATAEAAAHKAKEPAEASAQTETEAPAARAKAPADAATRKRWNLFRICNISAVAVATVEQGIASVKCAASSRTAGALLAGARDACAALDYDRTRPTAASAVAERSASASAASAIAVGCTVEGVAVATVENSSLAFILERHCSPRTAGASHCSRAGTSSWIVLDQVEASIFFSLRADLRAPHGAANSMPRATPAQSWGKGVRTFGSAPRLASVKGDLASV